MGKFSTVKSKLTIYLFFCVVPVQLTFVMIGGLGLSVSVVTWIVSVITPSLLGVNPSTDSEYWVAGSSNKNIIRVKKKIMT